MRRSGGDAAAQGVTDEAGLQRELGAGLVLRRATAGDSEVLAAFNGTVHGGDSWDETAAIWTRDLLRGDHPTGAWGTVVEEVTTGAIASAAFLIPQTWSYGGVTFGVGRPELIGTASRFRRRGLVRAQIEVLHGWSAARGDLLQGITGIPHFYRQFGYEPALAVGGWRTGDRSQVPTLPAGETEPYRVRSATDTDLPLARHLYDQATARCLVACVRDESLWRYELHGRNTRSDYWQQITTIEAADGTTVGLLVHRGALQDGTIDALVFELLPGVSYPSVTPSVLRYLWTTGEAYAVRDGKPLNTFSIGWVPDHPVAAVLPPGLVPPRRPFHWYVRVPDQPAFLGRIAPVLEQRLAASGLSGHTGELRLSFYRDGVRLVFEGGRLVTAEPWLPSPVAWGDAAFPGLTFLQLLLGARTLDELQHVFPDCRTEGPLTPALLRALFPKEPSNVWPVA